MQRLSCAVVLAGLLATGACGDQSSTPASLRSAPETSSMGKAPAPQPINVTSTLYNASAGVPLFTRSDNRDSTGGSASYTNINNMSSLVMTDGAWRLFIGNQTVRTAFLVLGGQGMKGIPDGYYWKNVEIYSKCFDATNTQVSIVQLAAGASNGNCSFGVDFYSGSAKYKLAMSPVYANTGRATVTCTAASGGCTSWTIVPNSAVANAGVANLYRYANNGSLVFVGAYRNSYSVGVTE